MSKTVNSLLVVVASMCISLSTSVDAQSYDPDGFHECVLSNVESGMGNQEWGIMQFWP